MSTRYLWIRPLQEPFDLGLDEKGRSRLAFNVMAFRDYSTTEFEDDLVTLLVAAGVAAFGTTLFVGARASYPDGTGPYLTIIPTGGMGPRLTQNSVATPAYQRPSAQLVARATSFVAARTMLRSAYGALASVINQTV